MTSSTLAAPATAASAPAVARPASPARSRHAWVDVSKGAGILLVVLGHAIIGVHDAGLLPPGSAWNEILRVIYLFHMPLFFFLAGLFAERWIGKPKLATCAGIVRRLAWPYILWSVVQLLVISSAGSAVNTPVRLHWTDIAQAVWSPPSQFWFLQCLMFCQLVAVLTLPLGRLALPLLGLVLLGMNDLLQPGYPLKSLLKSYVFFAAGGLLGPMVLAAAVLPRRRRVVTTLLGGAGFALMALLTQRLAGAVPTGGIALAAAAPGIVMLTGWAMLAGEGRAGRWLGALGRESLSIYLLHVFFTAGMRIVGHRLLPNADGDQLVLMCLGAGVAGPLAVLALTRRLGADRLLGLAR
ncbi:acyltransferase family protein [Derxia gummosa]|uniref:Acyltransferase family protein n=1 Tax=Derxia gummosa DSM 723 TaxID=1121388 RepID=A0A8B6X2N4_9BURK|nr:acyltransferase family protein [Derxia gummosa]